MDSDKHSIGYLLLFGLSLILNVVFSHSLTLFFHLIFGLALRSAFLQVPGSHYRLPAVSAGGAADFPQHPYRPGYHLRGMRRHNHAFETHMTATPTEAISYLLFFFLFFSSLLRHEGAADVAGATGSAAGEGGRNSLVCDGTIVSRLNLGELV